MQEAAQPRAGVQQESGHETVRSEMLRGAIKTLPLLLAVCAYGLVFGAQARQKGLQLLEVPLMTGSNYAGGSEFAAIGLWAMPPPILVIGAVTLLINSRHLIMGAALTPYLQRLPRWKALVLLFFMADENWALSYADTLNRAREDHPQPFSPGFYAGSAAGMYVGWIAFTTLGAALGPLLGDLDRYGVDMAFPAVFLALLAGMWRGPRAARPWLASLVVAALTYLLVPGAWYVVAGAVAGMGAALLQAGGAVEAASP